jgi:hypothetical protein
MFNTGLFILDILLYFILLIKISVIVLLIFERRLIKKNILKKNQIEKLFHYLHKYFQILMSLLLIILFNPLKNGFEITHHIKLFLFIFGILELTSTIELQKRLNLIKKS